MELTEPYFRSHAHIDTKRREPWLFNESEMKLIRTAIRTRYSFLPFWYTLFYEGSKTGLPPMRPRECLIVICGYSDTFPTGLNCSRT